MALISEVIKFEGPIDALVWKHPAEDFNTTSQLIVDETHEALLVVNGHAADLFGPGRHTLELANIPVVRSIINIPTDGKTPFPCSVFYINKVHHMDVLWGTQGPIALNDPLYDIFLHVGLCGSMTFSVKDSRKFVLKSVGLRDRFDPESLAKNFRGIISTQVKKYISRIMIDGLVSYFVINAHLYDIGEVVMEQLQKYFDDYGAELNIFNIETITVPDSDYKAITQAKERRSSRIIEGYTWQEERQMAIAEKFAGNQGTLGGVGGAVGGFMVGGAFGGTIADLARNVLSEDKIPSERPPKDLKDIKSPMGGGAPKPFDIDELLGDKPKAVEEKAGGEERFCKSCGNRLSSDMQFCPKCGTKQSIICPNCGAEPADGAAFCHKCGAKIL